MQDSPVVFFSKHFAKFNIAELIEKGREMGFEGYDLCCRPGHAVNPENVKTALPDAARQMREAGLDIPMITGHFDLLEPSHPTAEPILGAMQKAGIGFLKPGYYYIDNKKEDYWDKVSVIRKHFEGWEKLGEKYQVKICYHVHSHWTHMGCNAAAVMHLVNGFDPRWIGVYLDPAHLILDGEHPDIAVNMTKRYLAIIGCKDASKPPSPIGPGYQYTICRSGYGEVDWPRVFQNLRQADFRGPLSVHAEYERHMPADARGEKPDYISSLAGETKFYKDLRDEYL